MTKTISITDGAYEALVREKRDGESFTDVISRLTRRRVRLGDFAGIWKNIPERDLREAQQKLEILWANFGKEVKAPK